MFVSLLVALVTDPRCGMSTHYLLFFSIGVGLVCVGAVVGWLLRGRTSRDDDGGTLLSEASTAPLVADEPRPGDLVLDVQVDEWVTPTADVVPLSVERGGDLWRLIEQVVPRGAQVVGRLTTFTVAFSPETTLKLATGAAKLTRDGAGRALVVARGAHGQFTEHARVLIVGGLNPVTAAAAVWQVMAIVTAQKFLADIDAKLERIDAHLRRIDDWLQNGRQGQVVGAAQYFGETARHFDRISRHEGERELRMRNLEHWDTELRQIMAALIGDLASADAEIRQLTVVPGGNLPDQVRSVQALAARVQRIGAVYGGAAGVRLLGAQLRRSFPLEPEVSHARLVELEEQVASFRKAFDATANRLVSLPAKMKGHMFRKEATVDRFRADAREAALSLLREGRRPVREVHDGSRGLIERSELFLPNRGLRLAVEVRDGAMVSVGALPPPSATTTRAPTA